MSGVISSLKLALVGPLPPPFGGMANQTRQLSELLEKEGVFVRLIQTNAPYKPAWVGRIRWLRAVARLFPYLSMLWREIGRSEVVHIMANSGKSWYLFAVPAIWVAHRHRVPVIVNYRGGEADAFLQRNKRLFKVTIKDVAKLIVPSGYLKEVFSRYGVQAEVIPNVVDLGKFSQKTDKKKFPIEDPHLIVCRNLEEIYDIATALRAFKKILDLFPSAYLTVAGEGPEKKNLERLARELAITSRVRFAGRLNVQEMAELYRTADVMLNASRVDNMPNALLEAMSVGVPIVTTDAGGIPFIVQDLQTAMLVSIGDPDAMAEAAQRLLSDETLYRRLQENGHKEVKRYQWSAVKDQWLELYNKIKTKNLMN